MLYKAQGAVSGANFAAGMARRIEAMGREPEPHELEALIWAALKDGRKVTSEQTMWGWQTLRLLNRQILETFEEFDVYLCPVMGTPPFNFTGQPSLSLPLHMSASGLPIGMMFTGRYGDEATLFRLAAQLEKEMPWAGRQSKVWN